MVFINLLFIILFLYLSGFLMYLFGNFIPEIITNSFKYKYIYNLFPLGDNFLFSTLVFSILLLIGFYYIILKKFAPRWRVYSANRTVFNIRKGQEEQNYSFNQSISYLRKIDPFVFEEMLLSLMYERGFKIKRNKRYTGDGGSDGIFWIKGKKYHIQAKRYKSYINKSHMTEFINLISREKSGGVFIHTGKTGKQTQKLANDNDVFIISGKELIDLVLGNDIYIFDKSYKKIKRLKNK